MTVCVAVRVHDAMVFAADSASTLEARLPGGNSTVLNVYQYGDKVFSLYPGLPIVAMTCGMGNIGERAISSLAKDLRTRLVCGDKDWKISETDYSIKDISEKAKKFFFDERFSALNPAPANPHHFEFWIGGYSSNSETHELWKLTISNGQCQLQDLGIGLCGIRWGGQPEAITRLIKGFSPGLKDKLITGGISEPDATKIDIFAKTHFEVDLSSPSMPVQDAIDLAEFLVGTTKGFFRFKFGADTVGGETDVAVVTRHEGFKWIKRKHYYDRALNPLETDHAGHSKNKSGEARGTNRSALESEFANLRVSDPRLRQFRRQHDKPIKKRK